MVTDASLLPKMFRPCLDFFGINFLDFTLSLILPTICVVPGGSLLLQYGTGAEPAGRRPSDSNVGAGPASPVHQLHIHVPGCPTTKAK